MCRLGGDEFAVLCEEVADEREALALADRIGASIAEPMRVADAERRVTVSIGVVLTTSATDGPDRLLHHADTAMYEAKRRGKAQAYLLDPAGGEGR